jgi:ATP-GRASP peptide maturase of grasp-with-spasm system
MILIISNSGGTVNTVIDWIVSKGITVHRFSPYLENIRLKEIALTNSESDIEITFENHNITTKLSDYTGIWIWHGDIEFSNCKSTSTVGETNETIETINLSLDRHHRILKNYVNSFLTEHIDKTIGNVNVQSLNKLEVLLKAKKVGLEIPGSYITSTRTSLLRLQEMHPLITKPYHEAIFPLLNGVPFQNYTSSLTTDFINKQEDEEVFPTLVQEKIEKIFEVRSFFLKGEFYSMAIFSQASQQTQLDFRNYDFEKPNRTVPFKIPAALEKKLAKLFKILNLNSGSVDLIFTSDHKFKFLEINPVGQFGMVSFPCNYYLEERLMQHLTNE